MTQEGALEWREFAVHVGDSIKRKWSGRQAQLLRETYIGPGAGTLGKEAMRATVACQVGSGRMGWRGKAGGLEPHGQAVGLAPVRSDGPKLRHVAVERREQIREWVMRESGQSLGPDECGGMKGEGTQPKGWLLGFYTGWLRDYRTESVASTCGF